MSSKASAEVLIGGKVYTLSGYESEAYLQKVATYINNKINEFEALQDSHRFTSDMKATILELNIADDYFRAKSQAENLEMDLEERNKEVYELKHKLIEVQIKLESLEKNLEAMGQENKELQLEKVKLETSLEDIRAEKEELEKSK